MSLLQVKYIYLRKNISTSSEDIDKVVYQAPFEGMFKVLFSNVTDCSFSIDMGKKLYFVKYKYSCNRNGDTAYLSIEIEGTPFQCARVLNEVNNLLTKGSHRKDYNIILSFDGISLYFCNKIYPKFNLFERKIRELIFSILVKTFGAKWYDSTISNELKEEMATKGLKKQSDLIERALYEMTIFQLETYLFAPYREVDSNTVIDNDLSQAEINKKTKEEIIKILDKCRPRCLWERFFEGSIQISNLQTNLEAIRFYRNCVAHSKYFYKGDYDNCNRLINRLLRQIDRAIHDIEVRRFNKIDIDESLSVFSGATALFYKEILENMTPAIKEITKNISKIQLNLHKITFDTPKIDPKIIFRLSQLSTSIKIDPEVHAKLISTISLPNVKLNIDTQSVLEASDALNKMIINKIDDNFIQEQE
ncbi:hypothetical protein DEAC_c24170 [Desulfosporosinus acididurans]|uniref:Apea-like HEPN domain-containing protein n=1 Tax=Desulfosporosinus acididurans TaxID=476652 RepID=A0A0J1FR62_9FIRM|nr:hypothetical protein [Desulfosporosinus acididurans]KLU65787.1 hypothetical protein DEAC_c24170 [Desulfosporosinus acididurans]